MTACVQVDKPESQANLTLDVPEINFQAEFTGIKNDSTVVLVVTANRSWFAVLNDLDNPIDPSDESQHVSWGSINIDGHTNLEHRTDTVHMQVTIYRNKSQVPVNGVLDFYASGGRIARVNLSQAGAVYHLDAVPDKLQAECRPDNIRISIDCNTNWTVEVINATADVELAGTSGYDPGVVELKFGENMDVSSAKSATVKISATGCQDRILNFTQKAAEPYAAWSDMMSERLHAWEQTGKVVFRTNCAWTMEAVDGKLQNVVLEKSSGPAGVMGDQEVTFTFTNPEKDPQVMADATLILKTEYTEPVTIKVYQRAPLIVDLTKSDSYYSPALPTKEGTQETTHTFNYEGTDYSIAFMKPYFNGKNKVYFKGDGGYIKFPAIENATLAAVEVFIKADGTHYKNNSAIFSVDGQIQISDEFLFNQASTAANHRFILGYNGVKPEDSEVYMLKSLANMSCCINKIVLSYE